MGASFSKALKGAIHGDPGRELILTPLIHEWRKEHFGGAALTPEVMEVMAGIMMDDSNSNRGGRFGASAATDCQRRQVFSYLGERAVYGEELSPIFGDGTWRHLRWQAEGLMAGWFDEVEYKSTVPEYHLGVSLDAVNWSHPFGFELKGTSNLSKIKSDGVPPKHLGQMHRCMLATGLDTFVYMAESKTNQEFYEIVVRLDDRVMQEVEDELGQLAEHVDQGTLPEPLVGCLGRKGPEYRGCPFRHICLDYGEDIDG